MSEIPKKVLQVWISSTGEDEDVPVKWKTSSDISSKISPSWEYKLLRTKEAREFIAVHFPWFLKTYDALPYAVQKSDAIRYAWIYVHGGVYFDLDMQLRKPLDNLFTGVDNTLYLCKSANSFFLSNAFLASTSQNPIFIKLLERMSKGTPWPSALYLGKHMTVMYTSGPVAFTNVIHETKTSYTIVPRRLISQCSVCELSSGTGTGTCKVPSEYFVMVNGASHWNSWDSKIINFFMCNFKTILFIVLIALVLRYMGTVS